jgi:hypothetical protein
LCRLAIADQLAHDELVNLVAILLNAGTDTTRNQLAAAVQVLSDYLDQWALLAKHPELAPKAVEKLMRHSPIIFATLACRDHRHRPGRRSHPGGRLRLRQHRGRQPRSRDLSRLRPSRHHSGGPGTDADLRWWGAPLPRCPPRQNRARGSLAGHHSANAARPAHRPCPVETASRDQRSEFATHRIRRRILSIERNQRPTSWSCTVAVGGPLSVLRMGNGPELISQALQRFFDGKVGLSCIPPGCP